MTGAPGAGDGGPVVPTPVSALRWRTVSIEASTPAVQLARLPTLSGIGLLVRFPPGWSRPGNGSYDVAEEALFLAGRFEMSDERFRAGDHGWFPSGYIRAGSSSTTGALAWAWFSGPNHWQEAPADRSPTDLGRATAWVDRDERAVPELGRRARLLSQEEGRTSMVVDSLPEPVEVGADLRGIEVFDLATHAVAAIPAGGRLPALPVGPVIVVVVR